MDAGDSSLANTDGSQAVTGSSSVAIVLPIVAFIGMALWLGLVFYADSHPGYGRRKSRQGLAATAPQQAAGQLPAADLGELASHAGTSGILAPSPEQEEIDDEALAGRAS